MKVVTTRGWRVNDKMKIATGYCPKTGKICYRDRIAAQMALASCRHSPRGKRQERRIYRCPHCHAWHLTSKP